MLPVQHRPRRVADDPATRARVEADVADCIALGVQGTPTFFLDGEMLTLTSLEQFRAEVDAAASN